MRDVSSTATLDWSPYGLVREVGWVGEGHLNEPQQEEVLETVRHLMAGAEWAEGPLFRECHIGFCRDPDRCQWGVWGLVHATGARQ